jgi:hypothetical protein
LEVPNEAGQETELDRARVEALQRRSRLADIIFDKPQEAGQLLASTAKCVLTRERSGWLSGQICRTSEDLLLDGADIRVNVARLRQLDEVIGSEDAPLTAERTDDVAFEVALVALRHPLVVFDQLIVRKLSNLVF